MNPLDAATPADLFGADAEDPGRLKRAYARLVRTWNPEDHPAEFARIRELYEVAQGALSTARPLVESNATTTYDDAWVSACLAAPHDPGEPAVSPLEPDPAAVLDQLRRAAVAGSSPAFLAWIALLEALEPAAVLPALLASADIPGLPVWKVANEVARHRQSLVLEEDWRRLVERSPSGEPRGWLQTATVQMLFAVGRPLDAWERFEADEQEIGRALGPSRWVVLYTQTIRMGGHLQSVATLDRWVERLWAADRGLPEDLADSLSRVTCDAMALTGDGIEADLRAILQAEGLLRTARWLEVVQRPGWLDSFDTLQATRPGAWSAGIRGFEALSNRTGALWDWHAGTLETAPVDLEPLRLSREQQERRQAALRDARWARHRKTEGRSTACTVAGVAIAGIGTALGQPWTWVIGALLFWAAWYVSRGNVRPDVQDQLEPERLFREGEEVRKAILELCRASGRWVHEVAHAARDERGLREAFDVLLADPTSDLRALGPAHVRRASTGGG